MEQTIAPRRCSYSPADPKERLQYNVSLFSALQLRSSVSDVMWVSELGGRLSVQSTCRISMRTCAWFLSTQLNAENVAHICSPSVGGRGQRQADLGAFHLGTPQETLQLLWQSALLRSHLLIQPTSWRDTDHPSAICSSLANSPKSPTVAVHVTINPHLTSQHPDASSQTCMSYPHCWRTSSWSHWV